MTLQELLGQALLQQWFQPSYTRPLQTYVKKYAQALGHEANTCPPEVYHLPDDLIRDTLYQTVAVLDIQPRSVQAGINIILKLLHRAVTEGCLQALDTLPTRHRATTRIVHPLQYLYRTHPELRPKDIPEPKYTHYGLMDWPPDLAHETAAYLLWCTPELQRGRSKKIRKGQGAQTYAVQAVGYVAGYAVSVEGLDKETLTLRDLCEPKRLENFSWWWLQTRRGVSTRSLPKMLGVLKTIARHWYKDEALAVEIVGIFRRLDEEAPVQTVRYKEGRLLPLEELDRIARGYHPLAQGNMLALKDHKYAKRLIHHLGNPERYSLPPSMASKRPDRHGVTNFTYIAVWFQMSFLTRLLIHRPLRIGNIADLQFRHLHETPDGGYDIVIPKAEMKNGKFMYDRKEWREHFPKRLLPLFHEWLTMWRPRLQRKDGKFSDYVFLNALGRPHVVSKLTVNFGKMTLLMTQDRPGGPVVWHPHLIRTTWTREMLNAGLNPLVVRRIMGDSFQVIEKHYGGFERDRPSPFAMQLAKEIEQRLD